MAGIGKQTLLVGRPWNLPNSETKVIIDQMFRLSRKGSIAKFVIESQEKLLLVFDDETREIITKEDFKSTDVKTISKINQTIKSFALSVVTDEGSLRKKCADFMGWN